MNQSFSHLSFQSTLVNGDGRQAIIDHVRHLEMQVLECEQNIYVHEQAASKYLAELSRGGFCWQGYGAEYERQFLKEREDKEALVAKHQALALEAKKQLSICDFQIRETCKQLTAAELAISGLSFDLEQRKSSLVAKESEYQTKANQYASEVHQYQSKIHEAPQRESEARECESKARQCTDEMSQCQLEIQKLKCRMRELDEAARKHRNDASHLRSQTTVYQEHINEATKNQFKFQELAREVRERLSRLG